MSFTSLTLPVCTVSGATVTLIGVGECTIRATQPGDTNFNPAPPIERTFAILPARLGQTITFGTLSDRTFGDPSFTIHATASSGLPVSFTSLTLNICTVSGVTVTLLVAGLCTIRAVQSGNADYLSAEPVVQSFTINTRPQIITFAPLEDKTLDDPPFVLTATASSGLPVSFTTTTADRCVVHGALTTLIAAGLCTIRAEQPGNTNFLPADPITRSFNIATGSKLTQTISFASLSDRQLAEKSFPVSATTSSGLPVIFIADPATVCTVDGVTVILHNTGTCTVTAMQPGNEHYQAAKPVSQAFRVVGDKLDQHIDFPALVGRTLGAPAFTVTASASSGLPVTFLADPVTVCTISGAMVTLVGVGICSITATQDGNATYNPATPVTQTFTVNPKDLPHRVYLPAVNR